MGAATAELLAPHLTAAELGNVSSELSVVFANGLAVLVTGEDLEQTINAGLQVERFNRQLHHVGALGLQELIVNNPELNERDLQAIACADIKCAAQVNEADPNYKTVRELQDKGERLLASNVEEAQVWQEFKAEHPEQFTYTAANKALDAVYKHEQGVAIAKNSTQLVVGSAGTVAGVGLCETGIGCLFGLPLAGVSSVSAEEANNNLSAIYNGNYVYSNGALSLASFNPDNYPYIPEKVIPGTVGNWAATSTKTIPGHFSEDLPNPVTGDLTGLAWSVADIVPIGYIMKAGRLTKQAKDYDVSLPNKTTIGNTSQTDRPDFYVGPEGPSQTLPATGYRYDRYKNDDGTVSKWAEQIIETGEGRATYIGFEKLETGKEIRDRFQVKGPDKVNPENPKDKSWSDGRLRNEFDTLQLYDNSGKPIARVPRRLGDTKGEALEPITEAYPKFGNGGAVQLNVDGKTLKYDQTDILPEE